MLMLFLIVAMVHIVALMSPGPDFFFVSQTAVSRSRKEAMMGVLGITCGVMVWAGIDRGYCGSHHGFSRWYG